MIYWYKIAAPSNLSATYNIGSYCIDHTTHGTNALEPLKPWAACGAPYAIYLMGRIYRNGIGIPKDRAKGKALLRKATNPGSKEAAAELQTFWS